jgi:hypothetical protein
MSVFELVHRIVGAILGIPPTLFLILLGVISSALSDIYVLSFLLQKPVRHVP